MSADVTCKVLHAVRKGAAMVQQYLLHALPMSTLHHLRVHAERPAVCSIFHIKCWVLWPGSGPLGEKEELQAWLWAAWRGQACSASIKPRGSISDWCRGTDRVGRATGTDGLAVATWGGTPELPGANVMPAAGAQEEGVYRISCLLRGSGAAPPW
jgi:hypothetical protein